MDSVDTYPTSRQPIWLMVYSRPHGVPKALCLGKDWQRVVKR
jgi:hypothetical protein